MAEKDSEQDDNSEDDSTCARRKCRGKVPGYRDKYCCGKCRKRDTTHNWTRRR